MHARKFWAATLLSVATAAGLLAQAPASDAELNAAYKAVAQKDYDAGIELFRKALALQPTNAGAHKDLAYTLLKAGENADARDEFEAALKLNAHDETAALEFAFLAFETKKPIEARRTFDQLRHSATAATRNTAEQAFQNIDRPLADGIVRWKEAIARSATPNDLPMFSAHWELAQIAELRDDLPLAAREYEICKKLKPQLSEVLLILARVWLELNRVDEASAALLAASRSPDSRTAELALEHLPSRYPYPYEFVNALKLDPRNVTLRRELGFLYLAMHQDGNAAEQFQQVLAVDPADRLAREQLDAMHGFKSRPATAAGVASAPPTTAIDAKAMGEKSLALGYTRDAIKYLRQAHEQRPPDAEVMLKLGLAYNLANDDADALPYLDTARHAEDPAVAAQAAKAYHTLNGDPVAQTTVWALPMYSSRWGDFFTYGQVKHTIPLPWLGETNKYLSFYLSMRLDGDVKSGVLNQAVTPLYFSENAFTPAVGVSSKIWHHLTGWVEVGEAISYLPGRRDTGAAVPDYRGGLNFAKGFGSLLGSKRDGLFYETTGDAEYISRFDKDWLFYWQNRAGLTFNLWGASAQLLLNVDYTRDVKNQYWANTLDMGPGFRVHLPWMPPNVYFSTDLLRGAYTEKGYYPKRPNYDDVRIGLWYARTK